MTDIKVLPIYQKHICPHCSNPLLVNIRLTQPSIDWILKPEDIQKSKDKAIKEIEKIEFKDEKRKESLLGFLREKDSIISPDEVSILIGQLKKDNK